MTHTFLRTRFALPVIASLALGGLTLGCAAHVVTGGGGPEAEGTGGSASNQETGGSAVCAQYQGDGCTPGQTMECDTCTSGPYPNEVIGTTTCKLVLGEPCTSAWSTPLQQCGCSFYSTSSTPLVLSFDGAPVEYLATRDAGFTLDATRSEVTDWPTAKTPWLALDRDGNGRIDDGSELFGSMTVLSSGARARNGFEALRELDADGDGRITAADPGFAKLVVWADRDGDRRSSAGELTSAARWELVSIDLGYTSEPRCDARGNCEVERASFTWRDATGALRTGAIVDIHLPAQH